MSETKDFNFLLEHTYRFDLLPGHDGLLLCASMLIFFSIPFDGPLEDIVNDRVKRVPIR